MATLMHEFQDIFSREVDNYIAQLEPRRDDAACDGRPTSAGKRSRMDADSVASLRQLATDMTDSVLQSLSAIVTDETSDIASAEFDVGSVADSTSCDLTELEERRQELTIKVEQARAMEAQLRAELLGRLREGHDQDQLPALREGLLEIEGSNPHSTDGAVSKCVRLVEFQQNIAERVELSQAKMAASRELLLEADTLRDNVSKIERQQSRQLLPIERLLAATLEDDAMGGDDYEFAVLLKNQELCNRMQRRQHAAKFA